MLVVSILGSGSLPRPFEEPFRFLGVARYRIRPRPSIPWSIQYLGFAVVSCSAQIHVWRGIGDHDIRQKFVMSLLLLLAASGPEFRMYTYLSHGTLRDSLGSFECAIPLDDSQLW